MLKPAFVLGNGKSRLAFDLNLLKSHGRVFGCNALYRDFTPDVLIATDPGISEEIQNSGYALHNEFHTRQPISGLGALTIDHHYGFSSGPIAIKYAAIRGHKVIFIIGFDLAGIRGLQNNVYSGTTNYRPSGDTETYYGNWVNQITTVVSEHPDQIFIRVIPDDGIVPFQWVNKHNFYTQCIDEFRDSINKQLWQKPKELVTNIT